MKVLLISSNTLPAAPAGPAYLAGAVRRAGHEVRVFERLFSVDLKHDLTNVLHEFQPDVVGVSIRLVFGDSIDPYAPFGTRHTDLRPFVREIVNTVLETSAAWIVLGGPGFHYYARDWLNYLDLDYGIRGEGEETFPLFLRCLEEGGDRYTIPGCVFRENKQYHSVPTHFVEDLNQQALPAYDLFDMEKYAAYGVTPAIFTKRGCVFKCTFCPYSKLEGKGYRLKSSERVLAEIQYIRQHSASQRVMFCDNSFNVPKPHAESICRALITRGMDVQWGTGDLKPVGITDDFCRLMDDSGCFYANLAIESAAEEMLKQMKRGYTVRQVRTSLETMSRSGIPFGVSLMFGAPGETPETIAETLRVMADYDIPNGVWVTIGVYLWTALQDIVADLQNAGKLNDQQDLFSGEVYLSSALSKTYLEELLADLHSKPGYQVQVNQPGENRPWTNEVVPFANVTD
jgi:radical SAM superfamily enzyme YgiQ (UPF0313 family)